MTLYYSPSLRRFVKSLTDERVSAVLYLTSSIESLTIVFVAPGGGELALSGATASFAIGTFPSFTSVLATAESWSLTNDSKSAAMAVTVDTTEMRTALGTTSHVDAVAQLYLTHSSELVTSKLLPTRVINSVVRDGTEPPTASEDLLWTWLKARILVAGGLITRVVNDTLKTITLSVAVAWSDVTGKPSTFPPSSHSHSIADVTDLQDDLDAKAASSHTHSIADVTDLQDDLDAKAASSHTHSIADVTDLQDDLDAKLPLAGGTMDSGAVIAFDNLSSLRANPGGTGIDLVCSAAVVARWREGRMWYLSADSPYAVSIIKSTWEEIPQPTLDRTKGVVVGTVFESKNGVRWECVDNTEDSTGWGIVGNFRVLSDGDVVTYNDKAIRYDGNDQWVQLPEVVASRVGTIIDFYGYNSNGYTNGFYTGVDGTTILPPSGSERDWFAVPSRSRVRIQLGDDLMWRVTILDAGVVHIPFATGNVTIDIDSGSRFYYGYLSETTTFDISSNGESGCNMDRLEVAIGWVQSNPRLSLGSMVKMPYGVSSLMPIDLDTWRSYSFQLLKRGGYWTLKGPIQGPTVESED